MLAVWCSSSSSSRLRLAPLRSPGASVSAGGAGRHPWGRWDEMMRGGVGWGKGCSGREQAPSACVSWGEGEMVGRFRCLQHAVSAAGCWGGSRVGGGGEGENRRAVSASSQGPWPLALDSCTPWRVLPVLLSHCPSSFCCHSLCFPRCRLFLSWGSSSSTEAWPGRRSATLCCWMVGTTQRLAVELGANRPGESTRRVRLRPQARLAVVPSYQTFRQQ